MRDTIDMNTTLDTIQTTTEAFCDSCEDLTEVNPHTTTDGTLLLCDRCAN